MRGSHVNRPVGALRQRIGPAQPLVGHHRLQRIARPTFHRIVGWRCDVERVVAAHPESVRDVGRADGLHGRFDVGGRSALAQFRCFDRIERAAGQRLPVKRRSIVGDREAVRREGRLAAVGPAQGLAVDLDDHVLLDLRRLMAVERAKGVAGIKVDDDDRAARAGIGDVAGLAVSAEADVVEIGALQGHRLVEQDRLGDLIGGKIDAGQLGAAGQDFFIAGRRRV